MKRCSRCRDPHDRAGQRYCLSCQKIYMRDWRRKPKRVVVSGRPVAALKPVEEGCK
jgi:hypothetical protein